jgi:hypothetical protein
MSPIGSAKKREQIFTDLSLKIGGFKRWKYIQFYEVPRR